MAQSHCMVGPVLVANLSQVHAGKGTGVLPPPDKTWLLERNAFRPIVWLDSWPENHHVCHIFHIGKNDGKTMVMVFGKDLIHQNQYKPSSCDVFFPNRSCSTCSIYFVWGQFPPTKTQKTADGRTPSAPMARWCTMTSSAGSRR